MEETAKPCPFCGRQPYPSLSFGKLAIQCQNPKCKVRPSTWMTDNHNPNDVQSVLRAWNRRRADPKPQEDSE